MQFHFNQLHFIVRDNFSLANRKQSFFSVYVAAFLSHGIFPVPIFIESCNNFKVFGFHFVETLFWSLNFPSFENI